MGALRFPAPASRRTVHGLSVHTWAHSSPSAAPVLLIHGFASNTLFNWVKTGWLDPMADSGRTVISVDLPGHGESKQVNPAGLRTAEVLGDLQQVVHDDVGSPVALHGYSMGARLAWQFAYEHPGQVSSLVAGGCPTTDEAYRVDAEQARHWAAGGQQPQDKRTRRFITVAAAVPDQHLVNVVELRLSLSEDRYAPAETVPEVPTLVVAGAKDPIAVGGRELAHLVESRGVAAEFLELPGRNHVNALTSREYKAAVVDFLERTG